LDAERLVATMSSDRLTDALQRLPPKPHDDAKQSDKKRYSELVSAEVALAVAAELRKRGLRDTRPVSKSEATPQSGAERRMAGGIGAKKADVTWSTDQSGLLLGMSIKSINFRDQRTKNFQKNLTNRRGDMLFEAVTLHRRFPYAVLFGLFFLDIGATTDGSATRRSTFDNAHLRLRLFTGRDDPLGRDEQYERLWIVLHDSMQPSHASSNFFLAGNPQKPVAFQDVIAEALELVAGRNPDFYEVVGGSIRRAR
jgi:hypothetical protein